MPASTQAPRSAELHRIPCPYCGVGHGALAIDVLDGGRTKQARLRDPLKCDMCVRWFAVRAMTSFVGRRLDDEPPAADPAPRIGRPQ